MVKEKQNDVRTGAQEKNKIFALTLEGLQKQFPGKTMLTVSETAEAYGLKGGAQSLYNALRKNAPNPFPVKPKKRCGRLYFNIVHIAEDQAG